MPYFIYILQSESSGRYYIGHTEDLQKRIAQHNDPHYTLTTFTKTHKGPWVLVYSETFATRADAMKREREIKAKKSRCFIEELTKKGGC
jgi:putative endonuclease